MSTATDAEELSARATEGILGPNPFIGLRREDLMATAKALTNELATHPGLLVEQQAQLAQDLIGLFSGKSDIKPDRADKRFADPAWAQNPFLKMALGGYLAWTKSLNTMIDKTSFEPKTKEQARFLVSLVTEAAAPSNTLMNPTAVKRAIDSGGASVLAGLKNLTDDVINNHGMPSQVDKRAFTVGGNLALSLGRVVFKSEVLELIQYNPQTIEVRTRPLLIIPPQINKFYMNDLAPGRSFIEYLTRKGIQAFIVSWRNPVMEHKDWGIDTYVSALKEAIDACLEITGADMINVSGACSGAMTLAALLGHYAGTGVKKINSATLLVAVLDSNTETQLGLFATPEALKGARAAIAAKGITEGHEMARVFAWLRPTDLVWNYWINNYLLGNDPPVFDILFWNNDTTRLPSKFHAEILDNFAENKFKKAGALTVLGTPIDLKQITMDKYVVAGITDHITPWKGVYNTMMMFGGKSEMIVSASGHIQSLLNPPGNTRKVQYFTNPKRPKDPDEWLKGAKTTPGSWWDHWYAWLNARSGEMRPMPLTLGSEKHPPGAAAPGEYVFD